MGTIRPALLLWPISLAVFLPGLSIVKANNDPVSSEAVEFFEKKIRPVLAANCYNCHSADNKASGGLRVDDRNGLIAGGGRGAGVVPGKPDESLILRAVLKTDEKLQMPPDSKLTDEEIADLRTWIETGAAWPSPEVPYEVTEGNPHYEDLKKHHWSWQLLTNPAMPIGRLCFVESLSI